MIAAHGRIDTDSLRLTWSEASWDTVVYGYPVLQITDIEIRGSSAPSDFRAFENLRTEAGCGLVSCRLACAKLNESMFLESCGFRFVEMLYEPELLNLQNQRFPDDQGLDVSLALEEDLPDLIGMAGTSFGNERFHVDPRLPQPLANLRYQNWVRSSFTHPQQRLHVLRDGEKRVAFFVIEMRRDGTCYWHLNAVAPEAQGQGYGRRAWRAMIRQAQQSGAERVRTSIVARNHRVLNLYARLGFSFPVPLMTFHWVSSE